MHVRLPDQLPLGPHVYVAGPPRKPLLHVVVQGVPVYTVLPGHVTGAAFGSRFGRVGPQFTAVNQDVMKNDASGHLMTNDCM